MLKTRVPSDLITLEKRGLRLSFDYAVRVVIFSSGRCGGKALFDLMYTLFCLCLDLKCFRSRLVYQTRSSARLGVNEYVIYCARVGEYVLIYSGLFI